MSDSEMNEDGYDIVADPKEREHILSVLDSFRSYRRLAHFNGTHVRRQAFYSLPSEHWGLLSKPPFSILDTFSKLDDLIESNAELAEGIFVAGFQGFMAPTLDSDWVASIVPEKYAGDVFKVYSIVMDNLGVQATQIDIEKARSCVHQFYRDWSAEGVVERSACFDPILTALNDEFEPKFQSSPACRLSDFNVLIPGAGLGRLVFDICRAGYTVEGNEISYHALMASSLVLNHIKTPGQFRVAPFALSSSNHLNRADQFRTYQVPDVHPETELTKASEESEVHAFQRISMAAGDFCVSYNKEDSKETFDAVATVFFIDTAPNIIRYIETVRNCLKTGGIWINLGPLLWHHASRAQQSSDEEHEDTSGISHTHEDAGIADPGSVELTDEEVIALVQHLGFSIEKHETGTIETGYITNARSMLQSTYRPSFWIARKK